MNYYELLGISANASQKEIHKAYILLAKKYHPDMNNNSAEALDKMKKINIAYEILSDETKRAEYDKEIKVTQRESAYSKKKRYDDKDNDDYQKQAKDMWEEINKYYNESKADSEEEDISVNEKHKFPFYFSMWFIWLIYFAYPPYSICVSIMLTLGRYTELEKNNFNQKKITTISIFVFAIVGMVYWFFLKIPLKIVSF